MAIKLNLVKSRLISSKEDLISFRKEATAALLKFADSNDCDLDKISQLLVAKYAEIDKALNDGYQVESEVEIYPQPAASPVTATTGYVSVDSNYTPDQIVDALSEELHGVPFMSLDQEKQAQVVVTSERRGYMRKACMEPAKVPTTDEDVRRMIAASPQKQETANKIMAISSQLGQAVTWDLMTRIATGAYTAAELRELTGALRVVAAEDGEEAEEAPAAAAEEPTGHEPKPAATPEVAATPESAEVNSLLQQFNAEIDAVDPAHKLLKPITMDEVKATPPATPGEEDEAIPAAAPAAPVEPEVAPEPEAAPEPAAEAAPEQAEAPKYHVSADQDPTMGEQWLVINDATGDTEFQGASEAEAKEYMDSLIAEQQGK